MPVKAAAPKRKRMTKDGWINAATGLGILGQDKTVGGYFVADRLSQEECEELWRGNDIAARIVEVIPSEMLREGFTVKIGDGEADGQQIEKDLQAQCDELEVTERFTTALNYERAYGGGAIFIGAVDGAPDLKYPLDLNAIRNVAFLTEYEPRELTPTKYYNSGLSSKFGEPELFRVNPYTMSGRSSNAALSGKEVHESRFILFPGIRVSRRQRRENLGWGDSVFVRCLRALELFDQSWGGAGILLADFAQAVFKMKGLAEFIAANDESAIINRAKAMSLGRSISKLWIMDSEEDYHREVTPITGLPDTLDKFSLRLAAAADMPVSLLLGQSPAGLNATGDSDIRFFYDRIQAKREQKLRRRLERLIRILMLAQRSPTGGIEPKFWEAKFSPLWQETMSQKAETHLKQAQADVLYLEHSAVSPDEIARSRFGGGAYSVDTTLDKGTRELLLKGTVRVIGEQSSALDPNGEVTADPTPTNDPAPATSPAPTTTAPSVKPAFVLTPTDLATIVKVNQALASIGLPPLTKPDGSPDPDGELFMVEFQAKHRAPIAAAANAAEGSPNGAATTA